MITGKTTNAGLLGYGSELTTSYDGPSYTNQYAYSSGTYYNNTPSSNYSQSIPNPALKPADNKSYEGGVDLKMFRMQAWVFRLLILYQPGWSADLPAWCGNSTGFQTQNVNGVTTEKKGWELSVNASPLRSTRGLNWNILINWATYIEKLKSIYGNRTGAEPEWSRCIM